MNENYSCYLSILYGPCLLSWLSVGYEMLIRHPMGALRNATLVDYFSLACGLVLLKKGHTPITLLEL